MYSAAGIESLKLCWLIVLLIYCSFECTSAKIKWVFAAKSFNFSLTIGRKNGFSLSDY